MMISVINIIRALKVTLLEIFYLATFPILD